VFRFAILAISFLFIAALGFAQIPSGNVFVGYSYLSADLVPGDRANLNGWNASVEGRVLPLLGIVADFSGHYGSQNFPQLAGCSGCASPSNSVHQENYLFGPRLSFSVGKFRPFVHALIGASHISESAGPSPSDSDTSFSDAIGGGVDYHLIPLISWRVQADALQTRFFGATQQNVRISTGITFHF
jgi:opacity protein-like surface antigen